MDVRFSVSLPDYYCLIAHTQNSTTQAALITAKLIDYFGADGAYQSREVVCNSLDASRILKLANEHCPQAVAEIRNAIKLSKSGSN
jgi:hypothetical protein